MTSRLPYLVALATALTPGASAAAQTAVTLELGASQIGPALGLDAEDARFAMGGARLTMYGDEGSSLFASLLAGQALGDSTGGSFLSGMFEASLVDRWSDRWAGSMELKLLGFDVGEPFPYRTFAAEAGPAVRYRSPTTSLRVGVLGGVGQSKVELWRRLDGRQVSLHDDLWRVGTTAELLVGSATVQVGMAGSAHKAVGETWASLGGRLVLGGGWGVVELRADRWDTPLGYETTGGLAFALPLGWGWSFRGFVGRSDPDPLTLAQPGSGSGGALLGWSVYTTEPEVEAAVPGPYEVLAPTAAGRRVRLSLEAPEGAAQVQVLGDFTLWEPVTMQRDGRRWRVELDVPAGTHHYGFLIDDEWYVPEDTTDVVPDEWGRLSAILVIEGAGS